ncbi:uncharacterized protein LOC133184810 [Saccostrea echinata]|uniref:uncharacterized protein LOC133184810 n=1 Tax=Saccostrea echinata TaxID=191078 RepID=UPI002A810A16|nr:uncharacterized protein LOC133184810 [Saccostrea echinata]
MNDSSEENQQKMEERPLSTTDSAVIVVQSPDQDSQPMEKEDSKLSMLSHDTMGSLAETDDNVSLTEDQKLATQESAAMVANVIEMAEEHVHQIEEMEEGENDSSLEEGSVQSVKDEEWASQNGDLEDKSDKTSDASTQIGSTEQILVLEEAKEKQEEDSETKDVSPKEKIDDNECDENTKLPPLPQRARPANFKCLSTFGHSKWPIRNYAKFDFNVNAGHGGCAGLLLASDFYGGAGKCCNSRITFLRCGFDCNHFNCANLKDSKGEHFGPEQGYRVDEEGGFLGDLHMGNNHVMLLTNDSKNGRLGNGILVEASEDKTNLCVNVNGSLGSGNKNGGGTTLILCSGTVENKPVSAMYMISTGGKDNYMASCLMSGSDKWTYGVGENGSLHVNGPSDSRYAVYHNREELVMMETGIKQSNVLMTQAWNGQEPTVMVDNVPAHGCFVILCSNTSGADDHSCAGFYLVTVGADGIETKVISKLHGEGYTTGDLWKFEKSGNSIIVTGPKGPCRYTVLSNEEYKDQQYIFQDICLATGSPQPIRSQVEINKEGVQGIIEKASKVCIQVDGKVIRIFDPDDLTKVKEGYGFKRLWKSGELPCGANMVRVQIINKHVTLGTEECVHLDGSPRQLEVQKDLVHYALNCGGPTYTAVNDITYTSEHRQFASFTYDFNCGSRCLAYGKNHNLVNILELINNTHDGFLYASVRTKYTEPIDEQKVIYTVKTLDVPDGEYTLRLHYVGKGYKSHSISFNGKSINNQVAKFGDKVPDVGGQGLTAFHADIQVTVQNNNFVLNTDAPIAGFALLNKAYKDPSRSEEELKKESEEKSRLMDKVEPVMRTVMRKEMEIVGWSQNLIKNSSGEEGQLSFWNFSGDWKIIEGGYNAEKAFVTSHMWCTKYQEVDLTQHFSEEYLDTAPEIQVTEWYREGVCGGGHYKMTALVMDGDGNVMQRYNLPETGRIYRNNKWEQVGTTFKDYGPGARIVSIESSGKDDKYWGGHYGPIISSSVVRVKREAKPAQGDKFEDIELDSEDTSKLTNTVDSLVGKVLKDNKELLEEYLEEEVVPKFDEKFEKQVELSPASAVQVRKPRAKRKKREIRVFVSSTFKDFSREREEIIKKSFREINRICAERGVFFTYVDLRWGISSEQSSDGKTIAICLKEIERCRPYFLCLMGERFGWSQKSDSNDELLSKTYDYAVENYPSLKWIDEHRYNTSVTQLEVLHGVLNNIEMNTKRSFFYLRDPVQMGNMEEKEYKKFKSESEWHMERQMALRNMVEQLGEKANIRTFSQPTEVSQMIKEDLQVCIDEDFPIGSELTPLEREREAHQAFADVRCQVYIGREEYFTEIDSNMEKGINQPMVLLGESGCGKSALVANWVKRTQNKYPDAFIFVHFIGSSAESSSYLKLLRRLYEEMKIFFHLDLDIPNSDTTLVRELGKWLKICSTRQKCVIVLDALNQLDDGSKEDGVEHNLLWIPGNLPKNIFILLSTLPGRAMDSVLNFGWPTMKVSPLENSQKMEIITGYLEGIYGKTLSQEQKEMIVEAPQTNNPLYLRSLLDEVRMYGNFRMLTQKIQDYLQADSPGVLFTKILERLESDFNLDDTSTSGVGILLKKKQRTNMIRETTTAIWCSNRGMSENELVELLEVPMAVWSPFYMSLSDSLVNKDGILNFFHDHLRQAVERKYLSTAEEKKATYLKLANYFSTKELTDRVVDELPFLLAKAGELDRLKETIGNFDVFQRLIKDEDRTFELIKSWQLLGDYTLVEEEYFKKLSEIPESERGTENYSALLDDLGGFFVDLGLYKAARKVYEMLVTVIEARYKEDYTTVVYSAFAQKWKYRTRHPEVLNALQKLGLICEKLMELDASRYYYEDAIARQNRAVTPSQKLQLCEGLLGLAAVMNLKNDMPQSKKLLIRALELATEVLGRQHHFVAAILNKLGVLGYTQSRVDEALAYYLQDLKLTRSEVGVNHPRVARILGSIGMVYDDKNDKLAGELYESSLAMLLDTYGSAHVDVATVRYNLGTFYFATNYYAKAKFQFQEACNIYQAFLSEDHPDTKAAKQALEAVP